MFKVWKYWCQNWRSLIIFMAAVGPGPGCADVWTQIGVTTSTHRTLLGPQPAKCHIYVHKDITTLRHAMAAKKKRWTVHSISAVQWTPVCYIPRILLCWRHSFSDVTANHLHDKVSHRQWTQFCIVYCELLWPLSRHLPMTRGPHLYCLQLLHRPAVSTHYLHSIYSLSTLYLLSSHP